MADDTHFDDEAAARKEAFAATRRRFIQLMATTMGAALSGCGYGFVPSNTSNTNPLNVPLEPSDQKMLAFFDTLRQDSTLADRFILDPSSTMIAAGVLPPANSVQIARANRLVMYVLANKPLLEQLGAIASRHTNEHELFNSYTATNVNFDSFQAAKAAMSESDVDWKALFAEQVEVLFSDAKIRAIAGLDINEDKVPAFASNVSQSMIGEIQGRGEPRHRDMAAFAVAAANAIALANWKYAANVNFAANANFFANANWVWNWNYGPTPQLRGHEDATLSDWEHFLGNLTQHAERIQAQL